MLTSFSRRVAAILLVAGVPGLVVAEVVHAHAGGFSIRLEAPVMAPPALVYTVLTARIGEWWHPAHTFSGNSANLSIEDRAQGCFCEALANGGSVRHLEVVFAAPGKLLRLQGGLGPLQGLAATGSMSWHLHASEVGTRLELTYHVVGYLPDGMDPWAKPVESVLAEQLNRLKNLIETGEADATEADAEEEDSGETEATGATPPDTQ